MGRLINVQRLTGVSGLEQTERIASEGGAGRKVTAHRVGGKGGGATQGGHAIVSKGDGGRRLRAGPRGRARAGQGQGGVKNK